MTKTTWYNPDTDPLLTGDTAPVAKDKLNAIFTGTQTEFETRERIFTGCYTSPTLTIDNVNGKVDCTGLDAILAGVRLTTVGSWLFAGQSMAACTYSLQLDNTCAYLVTGTPNSAYLTLGTVQWDGTATLSSLAPAIPLLVLGTGDMQKAEFATNGAAGKVDHAAVADAAPWTGISGKPTIPTAASQLGNDSALPGETVKDALITLRDWMLWPNPVEMPGAVDILNDPPSAPSTSWYLIGDAPTGAWAGWTGIATYNSGWINSVPALNQPWLAYVTAKNALYQWNSDGWVKVAQFTGGSGGAVASVNTRTGAVTLTAADVNLNNLQNVLQLCPQATGITSAPISNTPPEMPTTGTYYWSGIDPGGAWAGHANSLCIWTGSAWTFNPIVYHFLFTDSSTLYLYRAGSGYSALLDAGGGGTEIVTVATKTADYTLTTDDQTVLMNSAGITATLPDATTCAGQVFTVKNLHAGDLTVNTLYPATAVSIPVMTGPTSPSGEASSSGFLNPGLEPWRAFAGGGHMYASEVGAYPKWLQYQFSTAIIPTYYTVEGVNGSDQYPTGWAFEASNDGSSWDTLDTQSGVTGIFNIMRTFYVATTNSYTYFRWVWYGDAGAGAVVVGVGMNIVGISARTTQRIDNANTITLAQYSSARIISDGTTYWKV